LGTIKGEVGVTSWGTRMETQLTEQALKHTHHQRDLGSAPSLESL
jgi:hypothetical protein